MKFPFYKGLVVFILLSVFSCQPKPEEVSLDLSAKKIKPALAEKMSKKFVNETSKLLMLSAEQDTIKENHRTDFQCRVGIPWMSFRVILMKVSVRLIL